MLLHLAHIQGKHLLLNNILIYKRMM